MKNFSLTLITAVQEGDRKASSILYPQLLTFVRGIIANVIGAKNRDKVNELGHDVVAHIMRKDVINRFDTCQSFKAWVSSITRNKCIDFYRYNTSREHVVYNSEMFCSTDTESEETECSILLNHSNGKQADFDYLMKEQSMMLSTAIKKLPSEDMQLIIELWYFYELKQEEIVEVTGWSESKIGVLHFRAKQKLGEILLKNGFNKWH